jgi:hypothetical protein
MNEPKIGALRVWHIPQVPGKPFHVYVDTPQEAQRLLNVLARYDMFQYENRIKPDCCNAAGLERYDADNGDGEPGWCEWCDEDTGDDIAEWVDPESASGQ